MAVFSKFASWIGKTFPEAWSKPSQQRDLQKFIKEEKEGVELLEGLNNTLALYNPDLNADGRPQTVIFEHKSPVCSVVTSPTESIAQRSQACTLDGIGNLIIPVYDAPSFTGKIENVIMARIASLSIQLSPMLKSAVQYVYGYGTFASRREEAARKSAAELEEETVKCMFHLIEHLLVRVKPNDRVILAMDGVIPCAKIPQERQVRYGAAMMDKRRVTVDGRTVVREQPLPQADRLFVCCESAERDLSVPPGQFEGEYVAPGMEWRYERLSKYDYRRILSPTDCSLPFRTSNLANAYLSCEHYIVARFLTSIGKENLAKMMHIPSDRADGFVNLTDRVDKFSSRTTAENGNIMWWCYEPERLMHDVLEHFRIQADAKAEQWRLKYAHDLLLGCAQAKADLHVTYREALAATRKAELWFYVRPSRPLVRPTKSSKLAAMDYDSRRLEWLERARDKSQVSLRLDYPEDLDGTCMRRALREPDDHDVILGEVYEIDNGDDVFDPNCILAGTEWMERIHRLIDEKYVRNVEWRRKYLFETTGLEYSSHRVPGEACQKIMETLQKLARMYINIKDIDSEEMVENLKQAAPNQHLIYGFDSEMMMVSFCRDVPGVVFLREEEPVTVERLRFEPKFTIEDLDMPSEELSMYHILQQDAAFESIYFFLHPTIQRTKNNRVTWDWLVRHRNKSPARHMGMDMVFIFCLLGNTVLPPIVSLTNLEAFGREAIFLEAYVKCSERMVGYSLVDARRCTVNWTNFLNFLGEMASCEKQLLQIIQNKALAMGMDEAIRKDPVFATKVEAASAKDTHLLHLDTTGGLHGNGQVLNPAKEVYRLIFQHLKRRDGQYSDLFLPRRQGTLDPRCGEAAMSMRSIQELTLDFDALHRQWVYETLKQMHAPVSKGGTLNSLGQPDEAVLRELEQIKSGEMDVVNCKRSSALSQFCENYVEGLHWSIIYYRMGNARANQQWFYKSHRTPMFKDLANYLHIEIETMAAIRTLKSHQAINPDEASYVGLGFHEVSQGVKYDMQTRLIMKTRVVQKNQKFLTPLHLMLLTLPPASYRLLPSDYQEILMSEVWTYSPLAHMMPQPGTDIRIDMEFRPLARDAVVLLPPMDVSAVMGLELHGYEHVEEKKSIVMPSAIREMFLREKGVEITTQDELDDYVDPETRLIMQNRRDAAHKLLAAGIPVDVEAYVRDLTQPDLSDAVPQPIFDSPPVTSRKTTAASTAEVITNDILYLHQDSYSVTNVPGCGPKERLVQPLPKKSRKMMATDFDEGYQSQNPSYQALERTPWWRNLLSREHFSPIEYPKTAGGHIVFVTVEHILQYLVLVRLSQMKVPNLKEFNLAPLISSLPVTSDNVLDEDIMKKIDEFAYDNSTKDLHLLAKPPMCLLPAALLRTHVRTTVSSLANSGSDKGHVKTTVASVMQLYDRLLWETEEVNSLLTDVFVHKANTSGDFREALLCTDSATLLTPGRVGKTVEDTPLMNAREYLRSPTTSRRLQSLTRLPDPPAVEEDQGVGTGLERDTPAPPPPKKPSKKRTAVATTDSDTEGAPKVKRSRLSNNDGDDEEEISMAIKEKGKGKGKKVVADIRTFCRNPTTTQTEITEAEPAEVEISSVAMDEVDEDGNVIDPHGDTIVLKRRAPIISTSDDEKEEEEEDGDNEVDEEEFDE